MYLEETNKDSKGQACLKNCKEASIDERRVESKGT